MGKVTGLCRTLKVAAQIEHVRHAVMLKSSHVLLKQVVSRA